MANGTHFTILLAGDCTVTAQLKDAVGETRSIAADAGIRHAGPLGLVPELWVGDFDSADPSAAARYADVTRTTYPTAKNMTDGEIAVRAALERGAERLTIVGAFGGPRIDHALATITLALSLPRDVEVELTDGVQWGVPLDPLRPARIEGRTGITLSVVGFTDLHGLVLSGTRWPLTNADVPFGSSLTVSNEIDAGGVMEATVGDGRALVIVTRSDAASL